MNKLAMALCFGLIFSLGIQARAEEKKPITAEGEKMSIQDGRQVSFDYTLTVDKEVIDSSKERGPLKYTHGKAEIIPGLASQLTGMTVGEEKLITVSPQDAYGEINPQALREFPKSSLPKGLEPKAGMVLQMKGPNGQTFPVKVAEVKDNSIVMDFNHPLAGKTLNFQVKIISIE